jgi:hypothetical protein
VSYASADNKQLRPQTGTEGRQVKTFIASVVLVVFVLAVLAVRPAGSASNDDLYWSSDKATVALSDSEWAAMHAIASVSCYGRGTVQRDEIGQPTFARVPCTLRNRNFKIVAWVTLTPTGPETFALSQLKGRPKVCR